MFEIGEIFPNRFLFHGIAFHAQDHDAEDHERDQCDGAENGHGWLLADSYWLMADS